MKTPDFQGTHLWKRLHWAKQNLEPIQTDIRVVYEDNENIDEPAKILIPDPNWMACAIQGRILPPVKVYWELKKDEEKSDFKKHTRGYLLHNTKPIDAMTEEQAIEYLIKKDVPSHIWQTWDKGNKPKLIICRTHQLPKHRQWRNAWKIKDDIQLVA